MVPISQTKDHSTQNEIIWETVDNNICVIVS